MILSIALISSSHGLSRTPLEKDIDDILFFDNGIKKGKTMAISQIRTPEGEQLWRQYIKLYQAERGPIQTEQLGKGVKTIWTCDCGRTNLSYVSTCACGMNKLEIPVEKRDLPRGGNRWHCVCGRINTRDIMICDCGRDQSEAPMD